MLLPWKRKKQRKDDKTTLLQYTVLWHQHDVRDGCGGDLEVIWSRVTVLVNLLWRPWSHTHCCTLIFIMVCYIFNKVQFSDMETFTVSPVCTERLRSRIEGTGQDLHTCRLHNGCCIHVCLSHWLVSCVSFGVLWVLCVLCLFVATLSRQPAVSSLKTTERSFRCASPCLRNQLPDSFHPHRQSYLDSPSRLLVEPSFSPSPLSAFITPSLFHPRLKIYLLSESFPPQ